MDRPGRLLGAGAVLLVLSVAALWRHYSLLCSTAGFTVLNLSFAAFTAAALSRKGLLARLRIPGASYVALISYSIYLTHSLAIDLTRGYGVVVTAIAILAFAVALHYGVERPSMVARDRLLKGQRSRISVMPLATNASFEEALAAERE
jgi:peptidoglycan/LPS O-acetylase OafA/YrhL